MYFTQVAPGLRLFVLSMLKKKKKNGVHLINLLLSASRDPVLIESCSRLKSMMMKRMFVALLLYLS